MSSENKSGKTGKKEHKPHEVEPGSELKNKENIKSSLPVYTTSSSDIAYMDPTISKFLSNKKSINGHHTHVTQINPIGSFKLEKSDMDEFWKIYNSLIYSYSVKETKSRGKSPAKEKKFPVLSIAEKQYEYQPVIGDIDLKVDVAEYKTMRDGLIARGVEMPNISKTQLYSKSDAEMMIKLMRDTIVEIGDSPKKFQLTCFLLEKPHPYIDKNRICSGFHPHFPFLYMDKKEQSVHFLPRLRKKVENAIEEGKLFRNTGIKKDAKIVDSVIDKHWLMYGSVKDPKKMWYKLSRILDINNNVISLKDALDDAHFFLNDSKGDEIKLIPESVEYYLPQILSTNPMDKGAYIMQARKSLEYIGKEDIKRAADSKREYDSLSLVAILKICKQLVPLLSVKRATDYDTWMHVGWTLYSIGDGSVEFLNLWIEFSKKTASDNFSESSCIYQWEKMEKMGVTLGTLHYMAKMDSPKEYEAYRRDLTRKRVDECLKGGDNDLAKMLYDTYSNDFVCADQTKSIWYKYVNRKWRINQNGRDLSTKISDELPNKFKNMARNLYEKKLEDAKDDEEDEEYEARRKEEDLKRKKIEKLLGRLKQHTSKKSIMAECKEVFYKEDFAERLDSNVFLLGFDNGVYDLKEMRFRDGVPDDMISLSTGYNYKEYTWEHPDVIEVENYLAKVFPDEDLRLYFKEYFAGMLRGGNITKTFLVMSGVGNNAKSVTQELLEKMFGRYAIKFPTSLLIGMRTQSSQASPEMIRSVGTRSAWLQEPSKKDKINVGILKELTGNDSMYCRGLFQGGVEIKPQFGLTLICNHLPSLPADDPAAWDRVRVLKYESRFLHSSLVPATEKEQIAKKIFHRDSNFSIKLEAMKAPLMWILIQHYKKIQKEGRAPEPAKVIEATTKYRHDNDIFLKFINNSIVSLKNIPIEQREKEEDGSEREHLMTMTEIYSMFKEWCNGESYQKNLMPTKDEMFEDLCIRFGMPDRGPYRWSGYRKRTIEDDEKEGKVLIIPLIEEKKESKEEKKEEKRESKKRKEESKEEKAETDDDNDNDDDVEDDEDEPSSEEDD